MVWPIFSHYMFPICFKLFHFDRNNDVDDDDGDGDDDDDPLN